MTLLLLWRKILATQLSRPNTWIIDNSYIVCIELWSRTRPCRSSEERQVLLDIIFCELSARNFEIEGVSFHHPTGCHISTDHRDNCLKYPAWRCGCSSSDSSGCTQVSAGKIQDPHTPGQVEYRTPPVRFLSYVLVHMDLFVFPSMMRSFNY